MQMTTSAATNTVAPIALTELQEPQGKGKPLLERRLELLKNVKVALHIRVGETEVTVDELMALKNGSVVKFARLVNEPMELMLDDDVVARGELVAVGDSLGFRVTEVSPLNA
jgi:flagellar motor switch protein FliN/FliY